MSPPSIKLTYFDIEGVAEAVRLALALSNKEYEDVRIKFPEWAELKPKTPYGQLPVMSIDDGPLRTQSKAMLRWVGKTFAPNTLYPGDKLFDIEEAIGIVEDFQAAFRPNLYPPSQFHPDDFFKSDEGKKLLQTAREDFAAKDIPKYASYFISLLSKNDGKWLASTDQPTIADCLAIPVLRNFTRGHIDHIPPTVLDEYPQIVDYIKRFCALEPIQGRYTNGIF